MAVSALTKLWARAVMLADAGAYFVATNPTPGTGVAFAVNASFDVTKNLFVFKNTAPPNGPRMYLDYIKIIPTVAPASATVANFSFVIDTVNRYTSGGTLIGPGGTATPSNVNGDSSAQALGGVYYATSAVITSPAAGANSRLVARGVLRSVIPAVNDEMLVVFGDASPGAGSSSGTNAGRTGTNAPPVIIGPQEWGVMTVWLPSNAITALSYEFEIGWAEIQPA
jgi:hypothetical protein